MKPNKYNYNSQSGMYRERVTLRQRKMVLDELFQEIESFTEFGSYWSMVKTSKTNEQLSAGQEQMKIQKRYVIKYGKSLQEFINAQHTSFELVHKGVSYDVKEVVDDNDLHETITIFVEGRV